MDREKILNELLDFRKPISYFEEMVRDLDVSDDEPIITIKLDKIKDILERFNNGQISKYSFSKLFELIELRDEFIYGVSKKEHDFIADIISMLANININFNSDVELYKYVTNIINEIMKHCR